MNYLINMKRKLPTYCYKLLYQNETLNFWRSKLCACAAILCTFYLACSAHVLAGSLRFASVRKEDELDNKYYQCNQYNPALKVKAGGSLKALSVTGPGNVP